MLPNGNSFYTGPSYNPNQFGANDSYLQNRGMDMGEEERRRRMMMMQQQQQNGWSGSNTGRSDYMSQQPQQNPINPFAGRSQINPSNPNMGQQQRPGYMGEQGRFNPNWAQRHPQQAQQANGFYNRYMNSGQQNPINPFSGGVGVGAPSPYGNTNYPQYGGTNQQPIMNRYDRGMGAD